MSIPEHLIEFHNQRRIEAEKHYTDELTPERSREEWKAFVEEATQDIVRTARAIQSLGSIAAALQESGSHAGVLRFLLAPPVSQDQFKLRCAAWQKGTEKSGAALSPEASEAVEKAILAWMDHDRRGVLEGDTELARGTALILAHQRLSTDRRMGHSKRQEEAVSELLRNLGFSEMIAKRVDIHGALEPRHYMRATQFAAADGSTHEVDVAIGLPSQRMLALECKVSNDATNSVKRVNDILKKATAWKKQWGVFVTTGALLQGVYSKNEPRRLLEEGVEVFWSHRLSELESWIEQKFTPSS